MKTSYTFVKGALIFVLFAGGQLVFAETDGTTGTDTGVTAEQVPASGQTTGKRQHSPLIIQKEIQARASSTRGRLKQEMEDRRGEIQEKRDELRGEMKERRMKIINKRAERIIHRLEAALGRLNNVAGRIDSRIMKLGEKGIDVTKAKADLALARTKIDAAKVKLDAAKVAIAGIINDMGTVATSTPGDTRGNILSDKIHLIKEQVRSVEEALKEAHKALVLATTDLKGKSDGERKKGTGTTTSAHIDNSLSN